MAPKYSLMALLSSLISASHVGSRSFALRSFQGETKIYLDAARSKKSSGLRATLDSQDEA